MAELLFKLCGWGGKLYLVDTTAQRLQHFGRTHSKNILPFTAFPTFIVAALVVRVDWLAAFLITNSRQSCQTKCHHFLFLSVALNIDVLAGFFVDYLSAAVRKRQQMLITKGSATWQSTDWQQLVWVESWTSYCIELFELTVLMLTIYLLLPFFYTAWLFNEGCPIWLACV